MRCLRSFAAIAVSPVLSKTIVVGSGVGVVLIVPLRVTLASGKLPGMKVTEPIPKIFPVAPANRPVPPVMVQFSISLKTPGVPDRVREPKYVPLSVAPLANVHVKSPSWKSAGGGCGMQWLCVGVNVPKLEVPMASPRLGLMFTVSSGEHLPLGLAGGV